jgi:hypothetical protein
MNLTTAKTAELVAFYNEHAAKPVTKFADRKTAERRVSELLATLKPAPKAVQEKKPAVDRSAAIAASWTDKRVAAARATRHAVRVTDPRGGQGSYKSVREAFMVLALPLGQHIKFRGALKAAGKGEFSGFKFKLVERQ